MSFLLLVLVAVLLNFAGSIDLSSLGEFQLVVVAGDVDWETERWLERYGPVMVCQTREELVSAVNDPSTSLIGVEMDGKRIKTMLSGDELTVWQQAAGTLPALYSQRQRAAQADVRILERPDILAGYRHIFPAMTLVVAMFMGCTFTAMNIISEKEDGVMFINEILPLSAKEYILQKIFTGFVCGCLSAAVTAAVCFRLPPDRAAAMLALILLSAFVASLAGLFVGHISAGLMEGVVYIKILMIVFMAVPLLNYLAAAENKVLSLICCLVPSSAAFHGIMNLAESDGSAAAAGKDMAILAVHCAAWFLLYLFLSKRRKKQ